MKKIFISFLILGFLLVGVVSVFAQFQSFSQISVGNNTIGQPISTGSIRMTSFYTASGSNKEKGTAYESIQQGNISLNGVGTANTYINASGAVIGQEEVVLKYGNVNTLTKVGSNTLFTTVNETNPAQTDGELWQTASGFSTNVTARSPGTGAVISSAYTTAPAVTAQYQFAGLPDSATVKAGAVGIQTKGSGPTDTTIDGPRFSAVTQYGEQHWTAGTFNFGGKLPPAPIVFNVTVSFDPAVSVLPPAVPAR